MANWKDESLSDKSRETIRKVINGSTCLTISAPGVSGALGWASLILSSQGFVSI